MPDTGALIGTPASISASVEPQTEPIDDEPPGSSPRRRGSCTGTRRFRDHGLERPLRECAVADVAALRAAQHAGLADREGREVVVVHVAPLALEREVVDPLSLLRRAERAEAEDLRLPAREEARAVCARAHRRVARDRADLLLAAPVRTPLLDRDLLADETGHGLRRLLT